MENKSISQVFKDFTKLPNDIKYKLYSIFTCEQTNSFLAGAKFQQLNDDTQVEIKQYLETLGIESMKKYLETWYSNYTDILDALKEYRKNHNDKKETYITIHDIATGRKQRVLYEGPINFSKSYPDYKHLKIYDVTALNNNDLLVDAIHDAEYNCETVEETIDKLTTLFKVMDSIGTLAYDILPLDDILTGLNLNGDDIDENE